MLAVCATVLPGSPKVLKISSRISWNVSSKEVALLAQKLFSSNVSIKEHKSSFIIAVHSMQGWKATMRHGVIKKNKHKKIKGYRKSV